MGQGKIDRFDAIGVGLAFADVTEAADAMVGLDAKFIFKWVDKGAEHVQQHAPTAFGDHLAHFIIYQGGKHNRPLALGNCDMVDLAHNLMRFVGSVDKRQPHMAHLGLKLSQNRVAEGFCSDSGAVGYEKNGAIGHGCGQVKTGSAHQDR